MFVKLQGQPEPRTYYSQTAQHTSRAPYLILASTSEKDANGFETLYGAIRMVAMAQCGQFMMGTARIAGESIGVSGSFGSDSLPLDLDRITVAEHWTDYREHWTRTLEPESERAARIRSKFVKVSPELAARYWRDPNDGWTFGDYRGIKAIGQAIASEISATQ